MTHSYYTFNEIAQQGEVWKKVYQIILKNKIELARLLADLKFDAESEVIFTGAGSSFFVGEMVAGYFLKNTGISSKAVSTTEIVTHPELHINPYRKTLLVSFARSGDSPESISAVELADQVSEKVDNLIITCNTEGELSTNSNIRSKFVLAMPEEANDKGLAMTSSVTSMAMAAMLFSQIDEIETLESKVDIASEYADGIIENYTAYLQKAASLDFNRAVFLGSGPLLGAAREGHLKLQELTDGKVICKFDSFLAFRHGPKVVVNNDTLMMYMFSNDEYVLQYELDLIASIKKEQNPKYTIGISENRLSVKAFNLPVFMTNKGNQLDEGFLAICSLVPVQLLAYYKSIDVGLNPDSPSESGAIHRVVQGVNIYEYKNESQYTNG